MESLLNTTSDYQPLQSNRQNHNFNNNSLTLNFTIMKKQMVLIIVALFASISVVFGQGATQGSGPRPLTDCETGPLNPIAGVPYEYSAEIIPAGGTAYWFATFNNTSFISGGTLTANQEAAGGDFIATGATNYRNSTPGATSPTTTTITWKSSGLAQVDATNPLFLAIHYEAPDMIGCADNLKVYRINPINAFLVNILNIGTAGYDIDAESCVSDIESAVYDMVNSEMMYDFGQNILAYEVVAANFTESYDLSLRIFGLEDDQTANIYWNYENNFTTATMLAGGPFFNTTVAGPTVETFVPNTQNGVSVFVWLEINNNNYEGLNDTPITLAVAGINSANQPNVRWDACEIPVDLMADLDDDNAPDHALHTLKARPTVLPGGGLNFEPQVQP
ncbi:MAG: hypothetical protein IH597_00405 [Bacteroidales bacterium]|nr:hypothetical protein [Bacteroidales bacterium]